MIRFDIVTVFPELITTYCSISIIGRAQQQNKVLIIAHNLRDWTKDKHRTVDDRVFGGGPGMLLKIEPLYQAIKDLKAKAVKDGFAPMVVATMATGDLYTQETAQKIASVDANIAYIVLCGHYEGFDARIEEFIDLKLSVGPYVLTGGEIPALLFIDSVSRLLPGVLGNEESSKQETTFSLSNGELIANGEHPQYTTPADFSYENEEGTTITLSVPEVLRSGHHKKITEENNSRRVRKPLVVGTK